MSRATSSPEPPPETTSETSSEATSVGWPVGAKEAIARWRPTSSLKNRAMAHLVAMGCKFWMTRLNQVVLVDADRFHTARATGRGVLTFSNHVGLFDDPLLIACLSGAEWKSLRWTGADALHFYGSALRAAVSNSGKCVPIIRGSGLKQPGMDFLAERLAAGEWVHLFPEGAQTRQPDALLHTPLKAGLADLIRRARPIVLPFHHRGMREVLPIGVIVPRVGHTVTVRFAESVDSAAGLADKSVAELTQWATEQLLALQAQALASPVAG